MAKRQRSADRIQTFEESLDPLLFVFRKLEVSLDNVVKSTGTLRLALFGLTKAMKTFAGDAVRQQRAFLSFNKTFSDVIKQTGNKLTDLPGGLKKSLDSLFAFEQVGLTSVTKSSLKLANRMQITGQNVGALVALDKRLIIQGTLSNIASQSLTTAVAETGLKFGVSTDILVGAMGQLGESMTVLGLTGGAGAATAAIGGLTEKFPQFGDSIGKFVDAIVTADIGELARLGILNDVDKLLAGQISPQQLEKLINKTAAGGGRFGDIRGGGLIETRVRMGIIGGAGVLAEQISRGMAQATPLGDTGKPDQIMADFLTTLQTVFEPLAREVGIFATAFLQKSAAFITGLNKIVPLKAILGLLFRLFVAMKVFQVTQFAFRRIQAMKRLGYSKIWTAQVLALKHNTAALYRKSTMGGIGKAGLLGFGPLGVALLAFSFLPAVLGALSDSTEKLADAEGDRAKAALRDRKDVEVGRSRFEELTKVLINDQLRRIEAAESVYGIQSEIMTDKIVDAVNKGTEATEDTATGTTIKRQNDD